MSGKSSGQATKANIILQSFLLFCTRQYEEVTYPDIEQATGLRRGSILYHFKTKQELFDAVVEATLLDKSAILEVPIPEGDVLRNFIDGFVCNCRRTQKSLAVHGIDHVFRAYYILGSSAYCHFDQFGKRLRQMRKVELGVWARVVSKAVEKGEIATTIDAELLARMFVDIYYGHAASSLRGDRPDGLEVLHKELMTLYKLVRS